MTPHAFTYVDERTLTDGAGKLHDVVSAIDELHWTRQWCPFMPHEYAILSKSPEDAWYLVEAMIRLSPKSYRAFFRGYERANRYWEAPDGRRYWRSRYEIDRWDASNNEGLRRVDEGAHQIKDSDGPRWAPNGEGYYVPQPGTKRWWPSPKFFSEGKVACLGCRLPPADVLEPMGRDRYLLVNSTPLADR
jgi:hypothetical protein